MKRAEGTEAAATQPGPPNGPDVDALQKRVRSLEEERDRLKTELSDVRDKHLRARADYENLVKRVAKETQDSIAAAKGTLLLRLVNFVETLERAERDLQAKHPENAKGVRLVLEEARKLLRDEGVKETESVGHTFNYRYHEAVERLETDEKPEGTILEVFQRGYMIRGEVLRPALVRVAAPRKGGKEEPSARPAA